MKSEDVEKIRVLLQRYGYSGIINAVNSVQGFEHEKICTIICDDITHTIPPEERIGKVYTFSESSIDLNGRSIEDQLSDRIHGLIDFLKAQNYSRVRIIFSGHAIMGAIVKYVVYRVLHVETEDVIYFGGKGYYTIKPFINQRLRTK